VAVNPKLAINPLAPARTSRTISRTDRILSETTRLAVDFFYLLQFKLTPEVPDIREKDRVWQNMHNVHCVDQNLITTTRVVYSSWILGLLAIGLLFFRIKVLFYVQTIGKIKDSFSLRMYIRV